MPDYDDNTTEDPKEKLRSLAERIQVGDTDEGAEAIQEMIGMVRDQGVARENVRAALRDELNDARLKSENQKALATFERKYPNVAKDGVLAEAAAHVIRDEIVEDLRAVGATDEDIARIQGDTGRLVAVHGQARLAGATLRTPEQILDAAGRTLQKKFNIQPTMRNPQEYVMNLREQRGLPVREQHEKPAGASDCGRGDAYGDGASLAARQERVRRMREERGFPVSRR
jgi:hypothetical protein